MKAETQTHKDIKNKKFMFPRNSLTYETCSEPTDLYISKIPYSQLIVAYVSILFRFLIGHSITH
jgi:hypothetical protein